MHIINYQKDERLTENSDRPVFLASQLSDFNHINKSRKIKIGLKNGQTYILEYTNWEYLYQELGFLVKILKNNKK